MAQLVALQMVSVPDVEENLKQVEALLNSISVDEPTLVVLPECFIFFGARDRDLLNVKETYKKGAIQQRLRELARRFGIWLVAGTIPVSIDNEERFTATSLVYDDQGNDVGRYDKIHLFDVEVSDSTKSYRESRYTKPGESILVVPDTPFGRLGVAVCYDIRFAGQFNAMAPVDVLALPAAFTQVTGKAHWHALLQCRSIELQSYVVAANQGGIHTNGRETFGHSCIYSPWGELQAQKTKGTGIAYSFSEIETVNKIRAQMPVNKQNRFRSEFE